MVKKAKQKRNKRSIGIVLLVCLVLVLAAGGVLARYISQNKQEAEMLASDFYISSNYLKSESAEYTISDWGEHGMTVLLYNYEIENTALIAEEDILYTIDVTSESVWNVKVLDNNNNEVATTQSGEYILSGDGETKVTHTLKFEYKGTGKPDKATVTVHTTAPYVKELQAEFTLYGYNVPDYTIEDKGAYALLTLYTNDYKGAVKINWDAEKFSPDNTNEYMTGWKDSYPSGSVSVNSYSIYEFIFVKKTQETFDEIRNSGAEILMEVGE